MLRRMTEHVIEFLIRHGPRMQVTCTEQQWHRAWELWDCEIDDVVQLGRRHWSTGTIELLPAPPGVTFSVRRGVRYR